MFSALLLSGSEPLSQSARGYPIHWVRDMHQPLHAQNNEVLSYVSFEVLNASHGRPKLDAVAINSALGIKIDHRSKSIIFPGIFFTLYRRGHCLTPE